MKLLKVGDKEYKLRLSSWAVYELELREKQSIVKLFQGAEDVSVIAPFVKVIHAALQEYQPEIDLKEAFKIYDELITVEKYNLKKLQDLVEDLLEQSGLNLGEE